MGNSVNTKYEAPNPKLFTPVLESKIPTFLKRWNLIFGVWNLTH